MELILDISGRAGLSGNFYGDGDQITPRPDRAIGSEETDIVGGVFNPYLRNGYLAPTTTTAVSGTIDIPTTTQFGSVEYDQANGNFYFGDRLMSIYTGTSLVDTSLARVDTIDSASYTGKKYDELHDLQIYTINGNRMLFHVGKGMPTGDGPLTEVATTGVADSFICAAMSINPLATTKPSITASARNVTTTSGTTNTQSFTVPNSTSRALIVVAFWPSNVSGPSCTFNGVSMSTELTSALGPSVKVFKMANPTATTADIVVTWGSAVSSSVVYAFVVDNTEQTEIMDTDLHLDQSPDNNSILFTLPFVNRYALNLVAAYSDDIMTPSDDNSSEIFNTTNTYGSDMLAVRPETGYGLQAGYAGLPATGLGGTNGSWLMSSAVGGFIQEITTDYAFMRVADNGFAYIFADNSVHKVDGTETGGEDGTVTKNVLLFPGSFRVTDAVDYRSRLYIVVHQYPVSVSDTSISTFTGRCGIYVWNRISTQLSQADYIELPGVREIKKIFASPDGLLKIITISDSGLTELRQFGYNDSGGVVFPVIRTLGIGAYPQFPDGLSTAGDKVVWLANDGNIYCNKGQSLTKLFQVKAPGTTTATLESNITSGALFYGNGDETGSAGFRSNKQAVTFSYLDGGTHYVKKIYPFDLTTGTNGTQTPHQGDVYTAVKMMPITSKVNQVRVYNAPTANSGSTVIATVKLYFNQSTSATMPNGMTKTVTLDEAKRGYVDFHINKQYVHAIQLEVEWATGTTIGDDMYMPSYAVISYEDTTTKSPDNG